MAKRKNANEQLKAWMDGISNMDLSRKEKEHKVEDLERKNIELSKENEAMKKYIENGVEFGYIDDREGEYKKFF